MSGDAYKKRKRRLALMARFPRCIWCGVKFTGLADTTLEHLVPLALGGTFRLDNCALACGKCNRRRGQWYGKHAARALERVRLRRAAAAANKRIEIAHAIRRALEPETASA